MMPSQGQFIPYGRQTISTEDINAVIDVLRSSHITQGPVVPSFEDQVGRKVGASHCVAVNSATSALHISCLALGLGPDDRLWTSPTTFVASANCGLYCGAEVDFVDIDINTGLMSIDALEEKLKTAKKENRLPKIVVPVHLCGSSCDMKAIKELGEEFGFRIIEDASHAIGGTFQDEWVGCCRYSDITVFSFHPVKIVTTGEGGMATTNSADVARRLRDLRSHGIIKDPERIKEKDAPPWLYEQQCLGFNYRITDIQAALGISQLARLEKIVNERRDMFSTYRELTREISGEFLEIPKSTSSSHHLAVYMLSDCSRHQHRNIFSGLRKDGIGVQVHYTPVHLQPYYKKRLGHRAGDYPEAEQYANRAITLPLYPGLSMDEMIYVRDRLKIRIEGELH